MKKAILFTILFVLSAASFSQQIKSTPTPTKQDYLDKSKRQKSGAWVLLVGGTALIGVGSLIGNRKESSFSEAGTGAVVAGLGFLSAIGSTPLFLAAHRNKKKGMSLSFKNEMAPQIQKGSFVDRSVPSLALKISL